MITFSNFLNHLPKLFLVSLLLIFAVACNAPSPDATPAKLEVNEPQVQPKPTETETIEEAIEPTPTLKPDATIVQLPTSIEVANLSGVSGYEIGIFGEGFGSDRGDVSILAQSAEIVEWDDSFIRVIVPNVADGSDEAGLLVTPPTGRASSSAEFTVYSIAPEFLVKPQTTFKNVSYGKPVALQGQAPLDGDVNRSQCTHLDNGYQLVPEDYLTDYACNSDIGAKFSADKSLGNEAVIAIDFEQPLDAGTYFFQFHSRADWSQAVPDSCTGTGYPSDYVVEASAQGDSWNETLVQVEGNLRGNLSHQVEVSADTRYIRLRVTHAVGDCLDYLDGHDFEIKEVRLFKVEGDPTAASQAFAIYGDSITAGAFNTFNGASNLNSRIANSYPSNMPFTPLGYAGRKAVQLEEEFEDPNELVDAFEGDVIAGSAFYWGVALGTNDMTITGIDDAGFDELNSHFNLFDEGIEEDFVQWLIERGRAPMIARMPDTNEAANGFGFIEAKIKILNDIDRISAEYQLIPGPDLYTEFRLNIERDNGSWISSDDGTHLVQPTHWVDLWADAFEKAVAMGQ